MEVAVLEGKEKDRSEVGVVESSMAAVVEVVGGWDWEDCMARSWACW